MAARLPDHIITKLREAVLNGESVSAIAKRTGHGEMTVRKYVADLRPPAPPRTVTMSRPKRVIIRYPDEADGTLRAVLVQPTGRFEWGYTPGRPEPQWLLEAVDSRDGLTKFFAVADISQWILPDRQGLAEAGLDKDPYSPLTKYV